jgi:hypothetical protein
MRRGQGNRHFQISKSNSAKMKAASIVGHRERLVDVSKPSSDEAPAAVSHPVEKTLPLRTARRIDHSQQGFTDGRHAAEFEDAPSEPAHSMGSEVPWMYAGH